MYCLYATTDKGLIDSFLDNKNVSDVPAVLKPIGEHCSASSFDKMLSNLDLQILKNSVYAFSRNPFYMIEVSNDSESYEELHSINTSTIRSISLVEQGYQFKFFNSKKVTKLFSVDGAIFARSFEWVSEPIRCDWENLSVHDRKLYDFEGVIAAVMIISHHVLNPGDADVFNYSIIHTLTQAVVEEYEVNCDVATVANKATELLGFAGVNSVPLRDFMNTRNVDLKDAIMLLESDKIDCKYFKLINKLFFKISDEMTQFKTSVVAMEPNAIYNSAYKIVTFSDFSQWFGMLHDDMKAESVYSVKEFVPDTGIDCECLEKLYNVKYLLEYLYDKWLSMEYKTFEDITPFIETVCLTMLN